MKHMAAGSGIFVQPTARQRESAIHRDPEHLAVSVEFDGQEVIGRFLVDGVVEHGAITFGAGIQADALELQRLQQMIDIEIVRILDAKNAQQVFLAELFGVVAQVIADVAFRLLGELRPECIARDFIEARRIRDEHPDLREHFLGESVAVRVDVYRHVASAHRQVEPPVAARSTRKLDSTDDG